MKINCYRKIRLASDQKCLRSWRCMVKFINEIRMSVDKGNLDGAVFIDLTKAFDTISHSKLLSKLPQYGIDGVELDWFKDYLFKRAAGVSNNNHTSQKCYLRSGVPQGLTEALLFGTAKRICKSNESLSIPYGNTVIRLINLISQRNTSTLVLKLTPH